MILELALVTLLATQPIDLAGECRQPSETQCAAYCVGACGISGVADSESFADYAQTSDEQDEIGCRCKCRGAFGWIELVRVCHWFKPPK